MRKKWIYKITAVLLLALMIPVALEVGAEEVNGFSSSSSSSYVTFYNARSKETALYIQKKVENASEEFPAPEDDEFEFTLMLDGEPVISMQYFLYDKDGNYVYTYRDGDEIIQTTEKDKTKLEEVLRTDQNGRFSIKAGQRARFSGLAPGTNYTIIESEPGDDYLLTSPSNEDASVTGTLQMEGASEVFTNLYLKGAPGTLEVRKAVSFPNNYELPESTTEFTFEIKIAGEPYANREFTIKDLKTKQKISVGTTDENGHFKLTGNTFALFEEIPEDVDYSVKELLTEEQIAAGWHTSGEDTFEGATTSSGTVTEFSNVLASFAVSKEMLGGVGAEGVFTFQVTNAAGTEGYGKLSYYLYNNALQLVDEELHTTDGDGFFTLAAGQRAVFVGLENGTQYGVAETNSGGYVRFLPSNGIYTDKEVTDYVEVLPFVNATEGTSTQLSVTKAVVNESQGGYVPDEEFTFRISRRVETLPAPTGEGGDGDSAGDDTGEGEESGYAYEPLNKAAYDIHDTTGTGTYTTDENGIFKLRAWQTAEFINLPVGETYRIEEITEEMPGGFVVTGENYVEGTLEEGGHIRVEIQNEYHGTLLPFIGGSGVLKFYFVGLLLIAAAAVLFLLKGKKEA